MKLRPGVSLVELLIVMSLCSLLLTTSAVVLHRTMHSQIKTKGFLSASRNGVRLSEQFRRDVHRARTVTTEGLPEGTILRLQLADKQVAEYQQVGGVIRRVLLEGQESVARDEFTFPASSGIAISQQVSPPLVSLAITSIPGDEGGPAQQAFATAVHLRIDAQPGREQRFTDLPPTQEEAP